MKPQPLTDQELQLRAQIDRLCAQRAELTLIIQGLRSMLPRPAKAASKRTLSIGELVRREGREESKGAERTLCSQPPPPPTPPPVRLIREGVGIVSPPTPEPQVVTFDEEPDDELPQFDPTLDIMKRFEQSSLAGAAVVAIWAAMILALIASI